jgi:hypothetical protein
MDPAETEREIRNLLAQLDGSAGDESLFKRVRGAYLRFQRKGSERKITL